MPVSFDNLLTDEINLLVGGMDSGRLPRLLPPSKSAFAFNATVRGGFPKDRPKYRKINLTFSDESTRSDFVSGLFQSSAYYNSDDNQPSLMASVSGNLYQFIVGLTNTATVSDITGGNPQSSTAIQTWMWQSERWLIWNDGINYPVFFDGLLTRRSNNPPAPYAYAVPIPGQAPQCPSPPGYGYLFFTTGAVGSKFTIYLSADYPGLVGDTLTLRNGNVTVFSIGAPGSKTIVVTQTTIGATTNFWSMSCDPNSTIPIIRNFTPGTELAPGRMGTYGRGRNWVSLPDSISFTASDLVGGSSGTAAYNFRDAVLKVTQNTQLVNGKPFRIPSSGNTIRGMKFSTTLDVSLGQGPLQVFTNKNVFSCDAPTNSSLWAAMTNPILTESLIGSGGASQESIINCNADIIFRSPDAAIRSLILARLDYNKWGDTPISYEMLRVLNLDNVSLTNFYSSSVFNNRALIACNPVQSDQGVYHRGIVAINFDEISSLGEKSPSIYDGLWTGLNVLQLISGTFADADRQFAFCLNTQTNEIELWEILQDGNETKDNDESSVIWGFESADLFRGQKGELIKVFKAIEDGEISVDDVRGDVAIRVYYKPDQYPGWVLWKEINISTDMSAVNAKPGYFPRMGLGRPDSTDCNGLTEQSMRFGYTFQTRTVIQGHCRVLGSKYSASIQSQPKFAQPVCDDKHRGVSIPTLDDFSIYNINSGITQLSQTP